MTAPDIATLPPDSLLRQFAMAAAEECTSRNYDSGVPLLPAMLSHEVESNAQSIIEVLHKRGLAVVKVP